MDGHNKDKCKGIHLLILQMPRRCCRCMAPLAPTQNAAQNNRYPSPELPARRFAVSPRDDFTFAALAAASSLSSAFCLGACAQRAQAESLCSLSPATAGSLPKHSQAQALFAATTTDGGTKAQIQTPSVELS